ncbi:MAG: hypothetical protein ACM3TT_02320 [Syntrophothermus sp.]
MISARFFNSPINGLMMRESPPPFELRSMMNRSIGWVSTKARSSLKFRHLEESVFMDTRQFLRQIPQILAPFFFPRGLGSKRTRREDEQKRAMPTSNTNWKTFSLFLSERFISRPSLLTSFANIGMPQMQKVQDPSGE